MKSRQNWLSFALIGLFVITSVLIYSDPVSAKRSKNKKKARGDPPQEEVSTNPVPIPHPALEAKETAMNEALLSCEAKKVEQEKQKKLKLSKPEKSMKK